MDIIEKLIKALEEVKEELSKNVNQSYSASPNMAKDDIVKPDKGYGKIIIKNPPAPKPPDPKKPYGKVIIKEEEGDKVNLNNPYNDQDEDNKKKLKKEELMCSANGQWSIMEKDAANPKLAPKEVKVKQLQAQVDAGTYKPDAGKIAGAMLNHPDRPLKKDEPHADDPKHEAKEKDKAEKIKEQAQEILDLHKK